MRYRFVYECIKCEAVGVELVDYDDVHNRTITGHIQRGLLETKRTTIIDVLNNAHVMTCTSCGCTDFNESESIEEAA